tara:strand:+ start:90 stop:449 length:360 start_codon:yes stop_codon:yes gene_type:complete
MAEGIARKYIKNITIYSAGIEAHGLNPYAINVMKEIDIDISNYKSKIITSEDIKSYDLVITLCGDAKDNCPLLDDKVIHKHWDLEDPASFIGNREERNRKFAEIRDVIYKNIKDLKERL